MEKEQVQVRNASPEDREIIYKMICGLENAVLDKAAFDRAFEKNIQNSQIRYFLAAYQDVIVGLVSCHIQPLLHHAALVAEIQEMYVEPEHRSRQIGKVLMEYVTAYAKHEGAVQIEVTSRSTREAAHRFYQREGFAKSHVKLVRYFSKQEKSA